MSFNNLGLTAELRRAVSAQNYCKPTPIQSRAIPVILEGRDLLAAAQTGTGKTAAFTLPLLQRLQGNRLDRKQRPVRALVLTPTRELAAQVGASIRSYGKHLPLRSSVIFGGVNIRPQINALRRGVDILVATPGRLLDHVRQGHLDLSQVEILVLDEADRMLDMGFIVDIRKVIDQLPRKRQNLMFSATFSGEIKKLANSLLNQPDRIEIAPENPAATSVNQQIYGIAKSSKSTLLSELIKTQNWRQVLVFTRTKHGADRLARQLGKAQINASVIHGNKSQAARTRALADFKKGAARILVATDIAARGLDIDQLPQVVNYELPQVAEDYVHRIGRTGRAGHSGEAVSLVCAEESRQLADIEKLIGRRIERATAPGYALESIEVKPKPSSRTSKRPRPGARRRPRRNHRAGRPGSRTQAAPTPAH